MTNDTPIAEVGPEWWRSIPLPVLGNGYACFDQDAALMALARRALDGAAPVTELAVKEGLTEHVLEDLRRELRGLGLRCMHRRERLTGEPLFETFASEAGVVQLIIENNANVRLHAVLQGDDVVSRAREALRGLVKPVPEGRGRAFILTTRADTLAFSQVGCVGIEITRSNYSAEILQGFDHAVQDIRRASPCGRLVLVEGPPGTGKSYLMRGIMYAVEQADFLIIPPHLLPSMVGPSLVYALLDFVQELPEGRRAVLVLEDADECLVPRQADNIATIATLLDLTDGLLSALTDFRVLVSTNARHVEIDPAVVRPGRLCQHIHAGAINPDQANRALRDLVGRDALDAFHGPVPLAEVYQVARQLGWRPERPAAVEAAQ